MSKPVPTLNDLTYLGTLTGPTRGPVLGDAALGSGLALRNTGSGLKLYFCSRLNQATPQVIEADVPLSYSGALTGSHPIGALPCQFKMAWGLRWDPYSSTLYQTCHNNYDGSPVIQPTLSRGRIVSGALVSEGQWRFASRSSKMTDGGVTHVPSWFQSTYSVPRMAVGFGMYRSVVATGPASMGLALAAFDPPATGSTSDIAVTPLLSYPYSTHGPVNTPVGYQERMHRDTNYVNDVGGDQGYPKNPTTTGYTTWADWGYQCAVWIDTPDFSGFAAIVQRNTGRVWYTNTVNAMGWRYDFVVYSADDLGAVANGANPSSIQPVVDVPITWPGMPTNGQHADSPPHDITGVDFDPITGIFTFGVRFGAGTDAASYKTTYPVFLLSSTSGCS
jgi:hypothetical protein